MNKIIITGNLCKDIELRYTPNNIPVLQNTVAVRNDFKNANGEYDSEFINIVVWRKTAEFLKEYASKGSKVLVEGRLTTRSYDKQDGTKGYITEVVAEKVELLGSKSTQDKQDIKPSDFEEKQETDPFANVFSEFGEQVSIDDEFLD